MSLRQSQTVSEIVEKFRRKYTDTERKALRKLILLQHKDINERTLDRHLKKAFKQDTLEKEKARGQKPQHLPDRPAGLWDRLKSKLEPLGGNLVDLTVEKFSLSDTRDPITGWREKRYDTKTSIKGIMIFRGALELRAAAGVHLTPEHDVVLLTSDVIEDMDRLWWKDKLYETKNVEEIFEGYNLSYRIARLDERIV